MFDIKSLKELMGDSGIAKDLAEFAEMIENPDGIKNAGMAVLLDASTNKYADKCKDVFKKFTFGELAALAKLIAFISIAFKDGDAEATKEFVVTIASLFIKKIEESKGND